MATSAVADKNTALRPAPPLERPSTSPCSGEGTLQILSDTLRILLTAALVYCGAMTFVSVFRGFRASFMAPTGREGGVSIFSAMLHRNRPYRRDMYTEARQYWQNAYWRAWRGAFLYPACGFVLMRLLNALS